MYQIPRPSLSKNKNYKKVILYLPSLLSIEDNVHVPTSVPTWVNNRETGRVSHVLPRFGAGGAPPLLSDLLSCGRGELGSSQYLPR
jgi:hypothetical protein